jgi:hypothetical protein
MSTAVREIYGVETRRLALYLGGEAGLGGGRDEG